MILVAVEKIEFTFLGLELLEPNTLITDLILGILCVYFGLKLKRFSENQFFFQNWKKFLFIFGAGAIFGGIGHAFYNYFGILGKTPAWILSIIAVYFIERSMVSIHPREVFSIWLRKFSLLKLIFISASLFLIIIFGDPVLKERNSILLVIINSLISVTLSAGVLSLHYYRKGLSDHFLLLATGVLIMIPSAGVFILDVNLFQWFDKNDISHVLLGTGIAFFYIGLSRLFIQQPACLIQR